jgi:hypothetical protein
VLGALAARRGRQQSAAHASRTWWACVAGLA